jgi:hypothetical protein
VPQSREEFVSVVTGDAHGGKMETFVAERDFDEAYRALEAHTTPCVDVQVERTVYGYTEHSSSDYNPTLRRVGRDRAEFSLHVIHRPRGVGEDAPSGGIIVMAADLKWADPSRNEIVLYRPTIGYKNVAKSLIQWAEGSGADCPKLK